MSDILRQKSWTEEELSAVGFVRYARKKQLVMARTLPDAEAPLTFIWPLETIVVSAGYIICYDPGQDMREALKDYDHWPVRPDLFYRAYKQWDDPDWIPTPAEAHLMHSGCKPYLKAEGIWAKKLTTSTYVQSVESSQPVLVPVGQLLAIGTTGEPWYIDEPTFRSRYIEITH